mgnify:CR=1 FL=1
MTNNSHNKKGPVLPNRIVAYVSNCSTDMVRKVKARERKDNYQVLNNQKKILDFLERLKKSNSRENKSNDEQP